MYMYVFGQVVILLLKRTNIRFLYQQIINNCLPQALIIVTVKICYLNRGVLCNSVTLYTTEKRSTSKSIIKIYCENGTQYQYSFHILNQITSSLTKILQPLLYIIKTKLKQQYMYNLNSTKSLLISSIQATLKNKKLNCGMVYVKEFCPLLVVVMR